jgi:hypothetical protein
MTTSSKSNSRRLSRTGDPADDLGTQTHQLPDTGHAVGLDGDHPPGPTAHPTTSQYTEERDDMGAEKRRRQAGNYPTADQPSRIVIREITNHPHTPGTLTVFALLENGAGLAASVPLGDVDMVIRIGHKVANHLRKGGGPADPRQHARQYVFDTLREGRYLNDVPAAEAAVVSVLWLAWTAPDPQGALCREHMQSDAKVTLLLTEHSIYGRRAINGRMLLFPPDVELAEILQTFGMGPDTATMTRQLAPH